MFPIDMDETFTLSCGPPDPPSSPESGPNVLVAPSDAPALDALVDALMAGSSPKARADVVGVVVEELCTSVVWLQGPGPLKGETASLHRVLVAAQDHRNRSLSSGVHADPEWTPADRHRVKPAHA